MPGLAKWISNFKAFKTFFGKNRLIFRFKTLNAPQKGFSVLTGVTVLAGISECMGYLTNGYTVYSWCKDHITGRKEETERRKMRTDIAHGLAWSHYCRNLQHVLPDIEKNIEESRWYKGLSKKDRKKVAKKLYVLIPRKGYVHIPGTDDVKLESELIFEIDHTRYFKVLICSIKDGETKYYCLCECPDVLQIINEVNDIQSSGISSSKVQLFTADRKLVQIMRFYYAMSYLLCLKKNTGENARLLLYNESDRKLSNVLIDAIKEDLNVHGSEQKTRSLLMEEKILSAEEGKDIFYAYDVFVTHAEEVTCKDELGKINEQLKNRNWRMQILSEKDCFGKDWLEKIKYAATKCRWIVLLDKKGSESKTFMSSEHVASLKNILESRKVQTVAIVNKREQLHINEDLRCVTCIPYHEDEKLLIDTLYMVVSGLEVKLNNSEDLYLRPGDAAVGLAWEYAVKYLYKGLPELKKGLEETKKKLFEKTGIQFTLEETLFIVVPKSFKTCSWLADPTTQNPYQFQTYALSKHQFKYCCGQYAPLLDVIHQMKETGFLDEKQTESELLLFYNTAQDLMRILFAEKTNLHEFIYYDESEESPLAEVLAERVKCSVWRDILLLME